jgi:hypothetical protein
MKTSAGQDPETTTTRSSVSLTHYERLSFISRDFTSYEIEQRCVAEEVRQPVQSYLLNMAIQTRKHAAWDWGEVFRILANFLDDTLLRNRYYSAEND